MGLSFDELRAVNVKRCEEVFHPLTAWSPLEWAGAMCGEAGEAANKAKKLRRLEDADSELNTVERRKELVADILEELADTVIYADLLAARVGGDLGEAVRAKFNKDSDKRKKGSSFRL